MKIKITQVRVGYYEPKQEHYPEGSRDIESIIEIEEENISNDPLYMDYIEATDDVTIEVIEGE